MCSVCSSGISEVRIDMFVISRKIVMKIVGLWVCVCRFGLVSMFDYGIDSSRLIFSLILSCYISCCFELLRIVVCLVLIVWWMLILCVCCVIENVSMLYRFVFVSSRVIKFRVLNMLVSMVRYMCFFVIVLVWLCIL